MNAPIAVIDVDTHLTEPGDLWTSRLPKKYKEYAPHLVWDPARARERWQVGSHTLIGVQDQAHAGWKEFFPSTAASFEEAEPGGWDPVMNLAQELGLPVSFHIGFGSVDQEEVEGWRSYNDDLSLAPLSVLMFLGNANTIIDLCMRGICERFPGLKFVSVESGFGYVPFLLEAMDWQYKNNRGSLSRRGLPLPSEYFRRQVFATFWYEENVCRLLDLLPDNTMFESDYPHPTSLSPGPGTTAQDAKTTIARNLAGVPEDIRRKVLHDNAAKLYGLDTNWAHKPQGGTCDDHE